MLEAVLDGLARVQVALGEHVGAGGGGVRRRVAVRRGVPDHVVRVVAAGEERPAVTLLIVDGRVLGEVPRVVGELVSDERVRDGVELDGVDVLGVEVERRQDLVPAGGADDEHILRRSSPDREGERARVGVEPEAAEARLLPVPPLDD